MRFASVLAIPSRALNTIADSLVTRFGAPFCYTLWETCVSTWWSVRTPDEPKSTPSEASAKPPGPGPPSSARENASTFFEWGLTPPTFNGLSPAPESH